MLQAEPSEKSATESDGDQWIWMKHKRKRHGGVGVKQRHLV